MQTKPTSACIVYVATDASVRGFAVKVWVLDTMKEPLGFISCIYKPPSTVLARLRSITNS